LISAKPGETLRVTIQITSPDDLLNVMLVDLLPGGLEALDPNVFQDSQTMYINENQMCYWCRWFSFPVQQTKKDRVSFFSTNLYAGTHTTSYEALVVTSGTFALPPAKAHVMSQPEVMGLSAGGTFIVSPRT